MFWLLDTNIKDSYDFVQIFESDDINCIFGFPNAPFNVKLYVFVKSIINP